MNVEKAIEAKKAAMVLEEFFRHNDDLESMKKCQELSVRVLELILEMPIRVAVMDGKEKIREF